jgi:staphylococcal nuclease domain-containing protein 1
VNFSEPRFRHVVLTYITSELKIYVQYSDQGQKLEQLQNDLRELFHQKKPTDGHRPRKGELLAARFTVDNEWYRARVEKIEGNNRISVYFIDYGNREVITDVNRLTPLPPGRFFLFYSERFDCRILLFRFFTITRSSS